MKRARSATPVYEFLLDTNVVSYLIRKKSDRLARRFEAEPLKQFAISAVTAGEMMYGLAKRPEATKLASAVRAMLHNMAVLPWSFDTASRYGRLRARVEAKGITVSLSDLMIAAHAVEHNLRLVTADQGLLKLKPNVRVEDWTAENA